jgi:hypothetical protein
MELSMMTAGPSLKALGQREKHQKDFAKAGCRRFAKIPHWSAGRGGNPAR